MCNRHNTIVINKYKFNLELTHITYRNDIDIEQLNNR